MWTWEIDTGTLRSAAGTVVGSGYAGAPDHINLAISQALKDRGPIPEGRYLIDPPVDTRTHGPFVLWLTPNPSNQMFGRSGFGIHGDSVVHPGTASEGCIILARAIRQIIWASGDHHLQVRRSTFVVDDSTLRRA